MKLTWHGHSTFEISGGGHNVIIDPFLTGNPAAKAKPEEIEADAILLTHGHSDHFGDSLHIAKRLNIPVIAPFELASYCMKKGVQAHPMHLGGTHSFDFGTVKLTLAFHGSAVEEGDQLVYAGNPCGYLLTMEGRTVYHAGDTALFGDMKLIGERHRIDVALLPIGDNFTMGPEDALYAAELLKPGLVIPMHYNTFPLIAQNAQAFARRLESKGIRCTVLEPGQSLEV
jgi:L-ascorbate metabolism protein UlaG (beta-lactamase superfamily)